MPNLFNQPVQSVFTATMKKMGDESRIIRFTGTLSSTDRMGDVIETAGWDLKNFVKNPVFLWDHNPSMPPIGKVLKVEHTSTALVFDVEFARADINPFADTIFKSYEQGFLSAVSVGFIPKKVELIKSAEGEMTGFRVSEQELLELSAVSIPAHQDALAASLFKKSLDEEMRKVLMQKVSAKEQTAMVGLDQYFETLEKDLDLTTVVNEEDDPIMKEQLEALQKQVDALTAEVKTLISLRETVELSRGVVDTLNKSIVAMLSKTDSNPDLKSIVDGLGDKPKDGPDMTPVNKAIEALMGKLNGTTVFTPKGDK